MMMPPQIRFPNTRCPRNHAIRAHISPDAAERRTVSESERTLMSSPYLDMVASAGRATQRLAATVASKSVVRSCHGLHRGSQNGRRQKHATVSLFDGATRTALWPSLQHSYVVR